MKYIEIQLSALLLLVATFATAQELSQVMPEDQFVRATFGSSLIIENESVMVPQKGTFMMNIQHRFGVINDQFDELFGLYAPSNIRLGFNYSLLENLSIGAGLTKSASMVDLNIKYAILRQTESGSMPVSLTYFGNIGIESGDSPTYDFNSTDRYSYFHQLIIARKITRSFSAQIAPSVSHFNMIPETMDNDHFAISAYGRLKVSATTSVLAGVDQPITDHRIGNPHPNIAFGVEFTTSSHAFQVFFTNYFGILHQRNQVFNTNDYENGDFLIGFNITRLWNF